MGKVWWNLKMAAGETFQRACRCRPISSRWRQVGFLLRTIAVAMEGGHTWKGSICWRTSHFLVGQSQLLSHSTPADGLLVYKGSKRSSRIVPGLKTLCGRWGIRFLLLLFLLLWLFPNRYLNLIEGISWKRPWLLFGYIVMMVNVNKAGIDNEEGVQTVWEEG